MMEEERSIIAIALDDTVVSYGAGGRLLGLPRTSVVGKTELPRFTAAVVGPLADYAIKVRGVSREIGRKTISGSCRDGERGRNRLRAGLPPLLSVYLLHGGWEASPHVIDQLHHG